VHPLPPDDRSVGAYVKAVSAIRFFWLRVVALIVIVVVNAIWFPEAVVILITMIFGFLLFQFFLWRKPERQAKSKPDE
jgi:Flp pilus assembly protein TadB